MAVFVQRQLAPDLCFVLHTRHPGKLWIMWLHVKSFAACNELGCMQRAVGTQHCGPPRLDVCPCLPKHPSTTVTPKCAVACLQ